MRNTREQHLAAALLWLRNHYDVEFEPDNNLLVRTNLDLLVSFKKEVLDRVDEILADGPEITIEQQVAFRAKYPRQTK